MKNISKLYLLENEIPENCYECPLKEDYTDFPNIYCEVTGNIINNCGEDTSEKRHSNCPLRALNCIKMKTFLFYVRMWYFNPEKKDGLFILRCTCDNPYRIVGKLYSTSIEKINRIEYVLCTPEREKFWADEGYNIKDYKEPRLNYDE